MSKKELTASYLLWYIGCVKKETLLNKTNDIEKEEFNETPKQEYMER